MQIIAQRLQECAGVVSAVGIQIIAEEIEARFLSVANMPGSRTRESDPALVARFLYGYRNQDRSSSDTTRGQSGVVVRGLVLALGSVHDSGAVAWAEANRRGSVMESPKFEPTVAVVPPFRSAASSMTHGRGAIAAFDDTEYDGASRNRLLES